MSSHPNRTKGDEEAVAVIVIGLVCGGVFYLLTVIITAFVKIFLVLLAVTFSTAVLMGIFWRVRALLRNLLFRGLRRRTFLRQLGGDPEVVLRLPDRNRSRTPL